jgi:hypothetical protein
MAVPIYLPAHMVLTPGILPDLCARHARLAARQRKMTFSSRPPRWIYIFALLGVVPLLIAALVVRKTLVAPSWSFCDECLARRRKLGFSALGVIAVVAATGFVDDTLFAVGLAIGCLVVPVLFGLRSWSALAAADVTREGQALRLRKPGPGYVDHLPPPPPSGPIAPQYGPTAVPRSF